MSSRPKSFRRTPIFISVMGRSKRKDMAGLKEFCETGRVAAREAERAKSGAA